MNAPEEHERDIQAEAAAWVVRADGAPLGAGERRALDAWLAESEAHARAYAFARATWADLRHAGAGRHPAMATDDDDNLHSLATAQTPVSRRWVWQRLAASAVLAAAAGAYHVADPLTALRADYRTGPGEIRMITLPDGSTARLNTDSAIAFRFDAAERRVDLLAGEAAFDVAEVTDSDRRPFIVQAGDARARALGTRFSVRRHGTAVDITVLEHRVEVSPGTATGDGVVLSASQAVRYDRSAGLGEVRRVNPARALTWMEGRIVFDQTPLAEAVAELNRYRRGRIVVMNTALARRRVSGVFRLDKLDSAVSVIAAELGGRTMRVSPFLTAIY